MKWVEVLVMGLIFVLAGFFNSMFSMIIVGFILVIFGLVFGQLDKTIENMGERQ